MGTTGYDDFYRRVRERITAWASSEEGRRHRWTEYILLVPDMVHLLIRLLLDARVDTKLRGQVAAVLAYVMTPLDLIPEGFIGPVGFADDLLLMVLVVDRLLATVPREIVLRYWAGERDLLELIEKLLGSAREIVGTRVWRRLRGMGSDDERAAAHHAGS